MTRRRLLVCTLFGAVTVAGVDTADAQLGHVVETLRSAGGVYVSGGASLHGADCSGLVSVAQSLAMGQPPRRLGSTHTLLAGQWPHAIPGATPDHVFVIGADRGHMSARVGGVNVEATCCGRPFLIGPEARSPFTFPHVYHINEEVLA